MTLVSKIDAEAGVEAPSEPRRPRAGRIPHVAAHCFAETAETRAAFERFAADRRMDRASVRIVDGGVAAAKRYYADATTPNAIIIETSLGKDGLLAELDRFAEVCDPHTRVIVVGRDNDIALYRALVAHGVTEYLVAPLDPAALTEVIERMFCDADAPALGKVFAFIGAKGGVGSSTVAQNTAWAIAETHEQDVLLADLDLAFGTVALGCNVEHGRGVVDAIREIQRLDDALLERLMASRGDRLRLLSAPAALDSAAEVAPDTIEAVIEVAQRNLPVVALDLPHQWTGWIRATLTRADKVVVTATPTLSGMRNAVALIDAVKALRPNDADPLLALNQTGAPRRAEIPLKEIEATVNLPPACSIAFNAKLFGAADSRGLMISETAGGAKTARRFETLAEALTGKAGGRKRGLFSFRKT